MAKPKAEPEEDSVLDERGQLIVTLGGVDYVLRPSFEAISAIERQLRPIAQLAQEARLMNLAYEDMAIIVGECMKAHGKANPQDPLVATYTGSTPQRLAELIYEAGGPKISTRLALLLFAAITGGFTSSGEAKAGTMEMATTSTPAAA